MNTSSSCFCFWFMATWSGKHILCFLCPALILVPYTSLLIFASLVGLYKESRDCFVFFDLGLGWGCWSLVYLEVEEN